MLTRSDSDYMKKQWKAVASIQDFWYFFVPRVQGKRDQPRNYMKKLFSNVAIAVGVAPLAEGAITHYQISDQVLTPGDTLFIDFDNGAIQLNGTLPGAADIKLRFVNSSYQYINTQNASFWRVAADGSYFSVRYAYGAAMNLASVENLGYLEFEGGGNWVGDTGATTAYLGLRDINDSREAWIGIRFNDAGDTITVTDFAVAPGADNMTAGLTPVPEPAATGAVMALLAGCAGLYHRRRELAKRNKTGA